MTEQLHEAVNAALADGDLEPRLDDIFAGHKGDWTITVNTSDNTAQVVEGWAEYHTLPPFLKVVRWVPKKAENKPEPKAEPVKRKLVRK